MEIGMKIRQLRYKASLTQEQLAESLGVSPQAVSKWENAVTMPDISLLPSLAEVFGVTIDELFDLTAEQKLRRIESRMDLEEELEPDQFRDYEAFLREQLGRGGDRCRLLSLLAHLWHHRLEADAKKVSRYAREAIRLEPGKKDCQWLLQRAEGAVAWDWNVSNHAGVIEFYKELVRRAPGEVRPYYDLIENLLADRRTEEAAAALRELAGLPGCRPFLIPAYEAAIALAEGDRAKADDVMARALRESPEDPYLLFEAAQYYARRCAYDEAIRCYEASWAAEEDRKPRYIDALQGIAAIHEIRGDRDRAAQTQRRILDVLKNEWGFTEETVVRDTEREIERLMRK